jgi:hypothetical protein
LSGGGPENNQGPFWFQVVICGLPDSGQTKILKHLSEKHEKFLPEMTAHIEEGQTIPRGINYRVVEISGPSDPTLTSLAGAHALVFTASSDADFSACRNILLRIHQMFTCRVPLLVLVDKPLGSDGSLNRPIELLGLADLIEVGVSNLRIFSVCSETGGGLYEAFDWLTSYFLTGDGDIGQLSPSAVAVEQPNSSGLEN